MLLYILPLLKIVALILTKPTMAPTRSHLHLLVFFFLFSYTLQAFDRRADDACKILGCGEGQCVQDHNRSSGYHCECNRGWKTIRVPPMPFASCIVPNYFSCGHRAPPPPPAPIPSFNFTNVCNFVWCGDGDCIAEGTRHYCRCHQGAVNLRNNSTICVKQCVFKADCNHLGIGLTAPPPAHTPSSANSIGRGKNMIAYTIAEFLFIVVVFTSVFV